MRNKLILTGLLAAIAIPAAANAQYYDDDVRDERQDLREEQRELQEERRYGDRDDIRDEREDVRDAREDLHDERQDYREDYRDDRQDYRQDYRDDYRGNYYGNGQDRRYSAGRYYAPRGYAFRPADRGHRLNRAFLGGSYVIGDPRRYGLAAPRSRYARWIRHGNDVLLVDTRSGIVLDVRRNRFY